MFDRAFVATSVALGATLDEALAALGREDEAPETIRLVPATSAAELVAGLRAPTRPERAKALALAVHEVLQAVDEGKLR
ncbi:MAG: hypothetical protein U0270_02570 [Labilithrix sp.]